MGVPLRSTPIPRLHVERENMKISLSRYTALPCIFIQWLAISGCTFAVRSALALFINFDMMLPDITITVLRYSRSEVLVSIGVLTTIVLIISEITSKQNSLRLLFQVINLFYWLLFVTYVLVGLFLPLAKFSDLYLME